MLNYLWAGMILIGIIWGAAHGNMAAVTEGTLSGAKEAVTLCITMAGVMAFWMGVMEIAGKSGLIRSLTRFLRPFVRFLFPEIPEDHPVKEDISTNIIANVLGLGWAATPAGVKAMKGLSELNRHSDTASTSMCTFLILNISSLQLIPVNMIAYRSQYGSPAPASIIMPAIAATLISTAAGIVAAKVLAKGRRRR